MTFPAASLKHRGGDLYAYLFENKRTGLKRGVYWGTSLEFERVEHLNNQVATSMTTEWIPWKIRSWRQLDGQSLDCKYGDDGVEASFYSGVHDTAEEIKLSIHHDNAADFNVAMTLIVDFTGHDADDGDPALLVAGQGVVSFECVYYDPSEFENPPSSVEEARRIASNFLDLNDFEMQPRKSGGYKLLPKLA